MDITNFIHQQRQEGLLLGDYDKYRKHCSRRLATLRKRLGRSNGKKKYTAPAPVTTEDLEKDPHYAHLLLLSAERAWAHGQILKAAAVDDETRKTHHLAVSRFHKASTHSKALRDLIPTSSSTPFLEATAYSAVLSGTELLEKEHWEPAIGAFSVAKIVYTILAKQQTAISEQCKDAVSTIVDPSIRYAAYQLQLPRTMDVATVARNYFPKDEEKDTFKLIDEADSSIFADKMDVDAPAAAVTEIQWRGRTAPVEEADIAVALADAYAAEAAYDAEDKKGDSADAFDGILSAWQEAVDAARKTIDERRAEGVGMDQPKMQALQITLTAVTYALISWRIDRNRVMISNISKKRQPGQEVKGRKLAHLKEEVVLYDAIIQSIDTITALPGVPGDSALSAELAAKRHYFQSLRALSIAHSHALLNSLRPALALYFRSLQHLLAAIPTLPTSAPIPSHRGLYVAPSTATELRALLEATATRYRALVEIDELTANMAAGEGGRQQGALLERLEEWPEQGIDFESGIVSWPVKVLPVPVKPTFMDVAWNFIEYPDMKEARVISGGRVNEDILKGEESGSKRRGFLGSLWGR